MKGNVANTGTKRVGKADSSVCVPADQYKADKAELERFRAQEKTDAEKQAAKDKADLERFRAAETAEATKAAKSYK